MELFKGCRDLFVKNLSSEGLLVERTREGGAAVEKEKREGAKGKTPFLPHGETEEAEQGWPGRRRWRLPASPGTATHGERGKMERKTRRIDFPPHLEPGRCVEVDPRWRAKSSSGGSGGGAVEQERRRGLGEEVCSEAESEGEALL